MKKIYYLTLAAVILITSCQSKKRNVTDDINTLRHWIPSERKTNPTIILTIRDLVS